MSWLTNSRATGVVRYGTQADNLSNTAHDRRGPTIVDGVHHVALTGLLPDTTYFFELVSGSTVDDNRGARYTFHTAPTGGMPPAPNVIYGRLLEEDNATVAVGYMVFAVLRDGDQVASLGESTWLSTISNEYGEFEIELQARTADLTKYFQYQIGQDRIAVQGQCGQRGSLRTEVTTGIIDESTGLGDLGDLRLQLLATEQLTFVPS